MYEDFVVKEPYLGKDGRLRVSLFNPSTGERKGMSYPRYLMEIHLGEKIDPEDDVHHIDGNPLNNEISNLEIVNHREHCAEHSTKYRESVEVVCFMCGSEFELTPRQQRNKVQNETSGRYFCSRSCAGKYGAEVQNGRILPL